MPLEIANDVAWPHPSRLPLGAGWRGNCHASGQQVRAADEHVRDFCNLGYAVACPHLPQQRDWDAIRFCISHESRSQLTLSFVCELAHAPIEFGTLTFDLGIEGWVNSRINIAVDARVLRLANSYLQTYRLRRAVAA